MTVAGFIAGQRTEHHVPHTVACRALGVSESWFYKWRSRPEQPTKREVRRANGRWLVTWCAAGSMRSLRTSCGGAI
ncbi:hypothetical protein GCM10022206_35130 [Streptomyces chiangmaiensis]